MRYHARKVEHDGIKFDSIHEGVVYRDLALQQKAGLISKLQHHVKFIFFVNGVLVGSYTCDASYHDADDRVHVIDAKGFKKSKKTGKLLPRVDRDFRLRANLMKALFALEVEIV